MTTILTSDLTERLPAILAGLARGTEFLLTDRGQPVGRLLPAVQPVAPKEPGGWQLELDALRAEALSRANRYPPGFRLDDSRESIYAEREES